PAGTADAATAVPTRGPVADNHACWLAANCAMARSICPGGRAPGTPTAPVTAAQLASARHASLRLLSALFAGPAVTCAMARSTCPGRSLRHPPHNGRSPAIGQLPSRATAAIATLPAHCQPGIVGRLGHHLLMRPALKPGLLPVWRNRDTIQIGIDPRRAIALTGMRRAAGLLRLLDGSRDRAQVLGAARELGMDPEMADRVL